jgi:hypothetical protein
MYLTDDFVDEDVFDLVPAQTGKVLIYESGDSDAKPKPLVDKPSMSIKHVVSNSLVPILQKLSIHYSPVKCECQVLHVFFLFSFIISRPKQEDICL